MAQRSGVIASLHRRCTIMHSNPISAVVSLVAVKLLRTLTMDTRPLYTKARALPARCVSTPARPEIKALEISTVMTKRHEATDEELELIEMRYQQALALMNLEDLFAEGQLNCM
jgi:hypothetical protein